MDFSHKPVLLEETISSLRIDPEGIYVDGTLGGGGHSAEIAKRLKGGRLIGIDRDPDAIKAAGARLSGFANVTLVHSTYSRIKTILNDLEIGKVSGILLDVGVSSHQLDRPERGFSYSRNAPLDMRMSKSGKTAEELIHTLSEKELTKIFYEYGEERFSARIARAIVQEREKEPIRSTDKLAEIISRCVPSKSKREGHPAKRVFQAVRIAVNDELNELSQGLTDAFDCLRQGGILSVITFHSLEDRIVKTRFRELTSGCICPKDFPVCVCGRSPLGKLVHKKPITAGSEELKENPRSKSAKLRALEKL